MTAAFLTDRRPPIPWKAPAAAPFADAKVHLGRGNPPLEVLAVSAPADRNQALIRSLWKARLGGRAVPLIVAVVHDDARATLCGPLGIKDDPPVHPTLDRGQAERVCREALDQPNKEAALRFLRDALPAVRSDLPGVRNEGFLATYELVHGAPRMGRWNEHTARGRPLLGKTDADLLAGLGFELSEIDSLSTLLRASADRSRIGVAVVLHAGEDFDLEAGRFNGLSPVSYALTVARREALPYVLVCQGPKVRLYPAGLGVGVGRRGPTETFVELHTNLVRDDHAGYVWALLSADALAPGGTLGHLLTESRRFAGRLAVRLRERVYEKVIPELAKALVVARKLKDPDAAKLAETYRMAMTVLFRLLFIAYAEDKDLLPYKWNDEYKDRSLKRKAQVLLRQHLDGIEFEGHSHSHWKDVDQLFEAVSGGHSEWGIPAYGGELFARDGTESTIGAGLARLSLPNAVFGPALRDLLLIETPDTDAAGNPVLGPVDFRSLGVREFGTIYEGLLESELAVAEADLTTDKDGYYRPARTGDAVVVRKGDVYLHNRSGARMRPGRTSPRSSPSITCSTRPSTRPWPTTWPGSTPCRTTRRRSSSSTSGWPTSRWGRPTSWSPPWTGSSRRSPTTSRTAACRGCGPSWRPCGPPPRPPWASWPSWSGPSWRTPGCSAGRSPGGASTGWT